MSALEDDRTAALRGTAGPALLLVDVQHDFAAPEQLSAWGVSPEDIAAVDAAVDRCADLVAGARAAGVPIVWIELAYDPTRPWRSSAWLTTGSPDSPTDGFPCVAGSPGAEWWRLEPGDGEPRVQKRFYSGFAETGLAAVLSDLDVGWVTIAGLTTECCILATAFDAVQHDLPVVVVDDATAAYTPELHRGALESLALNVADIRPTREVVALWQETTR